MAAYQGSNQQGLLKEEKKKKKEKIESVIDSHCWRCKKIKQLSAAHSA